MKITPCQNHVDEFQCRTFLEVSTPLDDVPAEEISLKTMDVFRFNIKNCNRLLIPFRCIFNCWTMCQKPRFADKRTNMIFKTVISGPNVDDIVLDTTLNVQQNPGRGSKIVKTGQRQAALYPSHTDLNGVIRATKITMPITLELDIKMEKSRIFDRDRYVRQMTADLTYHAQLLHFRDQKLYDQLPPAIHMNKEQRQSIIKQMETDSASNNNQSEASTSRDNTPSPDSMPEGLDNNIPILPDARPVITVTIELPRNFYQVLGLQQGQSEILNLRKELEMHAIGRTNECLRKAMYEKNGKVIECNHLKGMINAANSRVEALTGENQHLKQRLQEMYLHMHQMGRNQIEMQNFST